MKSLKDYLQESFINDARYDTSYIVSEGIDIDASSKVVRLTDKHTKGVDFDIQEPWHTSIDGMNVYSLFKRTKLGSKPERDGNPFIYALKEKNGWTFDITDKEIINYCRKFVSQCTKLKNKYDIILMCPSSSKVNERFIKSLSSIIKTPKVLDIFGKISVEEADDSLDRDKMKAYCEANHKDFSTEYNKIQNAYDKMNDDTFEAKYIPKEYLQFYGHILSFGKKYEIFDLYKTVFDKNVLILDDIVSSGATLKNSADEVKAWGAKHIDAITLLSPLT